MRTIISVLFCASIMLVSCSSNQQKNNTVGQKELANPDKNGEAKNCDEFIDRYEEWMDNYLEMIEKYMKNPMDATLSAEYMKLAQEGADWMTQWNGKLYYCASKEKYQKRFDEISEKAEKKLDQMGIE